jgi:hypothetical protein
MKVSPAQVRDHTNFRAVRRGGHKVYQFLNGSTFVDWVYVAPTEHGLGLFAARDFKKQEPVVAYFGDLWRETEHGRDGSELNESTMVMKSGVKGWLIRGSKKSAASFANDKRGSGRLANLRIVPSQQSIRMSQAQLALFKAAGKAAGSLGVDSHPQAVGPTLVYYRTTNAVKTGTQLLANYRWKKSDFKPSQ